MLCNEGSIVGDGKHTDLVSLEVNIFDFNVAARVNGDVRGRERC